MRAVQDASQAGEAVAAAIREHDLAKVRALLDATPELLHIGDERSNQPIHWAAMTRQLDFIDELLRRGADINAARFDGAHPFNSPTATTIFAAGATCPPIGPSRPHK